MLSHDYIIENSILDSICSLSIYPSPHSHTLAGITGNATKLYITQPILVNRATSHHHHSVKLSLSSSLIWGRAGSSLILRRSRPLQRISLLVWSSSIASQNHWCPDQTDKNWDQGKSKRTKSVEHADPNLEFSKKQISPRLRWYNVIVLQVWNMSVFLQLRNSLLGSIHLPPSCTFIKHGWGTDKLQHEQTSLLHCPPRWHHLPWQHFSLLFGFF